MDDFAHARLASIISGRYDGMSDYSWLDLPPPVHGHGIAKSIERMSDETLQVEHGSLYPALQRLQQERWITAEWGGTKNNQRAKYYRLTPLGRRQLVAETSHWERSVKAGTGVLIGLGIGANTAMFQLLGAVRLRTLPVRNPEELTHVHLEDRSGKRANPETVYPALNVPSW